MGKMIFLPEYLFLLKNDFLPIGPTIYSRIGRVNLGSSRNALPCTCRAGVEILRLQFSTLLELKRDFEIDSPC